MAQLVRQVIEIPRHDINGWIRCQIGRLAWPVLLRPIDECRPKTHRPCSLEIVVVGGHHHNLVWLETEQRGSRQVYLGVSL